MFLCKCSRCHEEVAIHDKYVGQVTKCPKCDRSFLAPDKKDVQFFYDNDDFRDKEPATQPTTAVLAKRSFLLTSSLLLFATLMAFGIILSMGARNKLRDTSLPRQEIDEISNSIGRYINAQTATITLIAIVSYAAVSLVGFYAAGLYMGQDAARRGLSPLPWFLSYFGWNIISRVILGVYLSFLAKFAPSFVVALAVEPLHYTLLYFYFMVRPKGRLKPCETCGNMALAMIKDCPHCHHLFK